MDLGIKGRKAIVNGGSAGMGRGSVLALAREGCELYVSARGKARLDETCAAISEETGASVTPICADHSTDEGRREILASCPEPDILVGTCSPPPHTGDYRTVTARDWDVNLSVALLSPVYFMQAVLDGMVERGWGRIVNIATGAAKFPHQIRILSGAPRAMTKQRSRIKVNRLYSLPGRGRLLTKAAENSQRQQRNLRFNQLTRGLIDGRRL